MSILLECDDWSGLLIADMQFFTDFDRDGFTYDLTVALDKRGKSEIIYDFDTNKPWSTVWQQETKKLVDSINKGEYSLVLLPPDDFNLFITNSGASQGDVQITHNIRVSSGEIGFLEAGRAIETFCADEPIELAYTTSIPNGIYSVTYNIFRDTKNIEVTIQPAAGQAKSIDSLQNPFQ
ncbi:hypothetical protein H0A36_28495 [Endozoicomonas sp. SM1973]|uniref:Uncharacterized protein n=1 Tax=Spartinivicinus marinus TaxID=2994442 RepID=A0A853IKR9_9GAMM|nr:hypothetical protein [Spartinivicinus marinus]MCX4027244.1 hypothetical protein [Spartinivicinus marinus]NYZ69957.1 hypothetical protein [Spartinivicinus marinus]